MIEIPSAAILADSFAREADFLSIGTNDLVQYTLAADRTSQALAHLATPYDPSVLRLVHGVAAAGRRRDRVVSLCGEMASEPLGAILLVGLGLRDLSMESSSVPEIKEAIHRVTLDEAEAVAKAVLEMDTADAVTSELERAFGPRLTDLLTISG